MHRVEYHRRAEKALRRMPRERASQILGAIGELASSDEPTLHPNVKKMQGEREGLWRLRVGTYRAIFKLVDEPGGKYLIIVTAVGGRGDIY